LASAIGTLMSSPNVIGEYIGKIREAVNAK
jgi:hypothetical protein